MPIEAGNPAGQHRGMMPRRPQTDFTPTTTELFIMNSPQYHTVQKLAIGLGWFGIALGVGELVAGGPLSRWLGLRRRGALIRSYGAREVVTGAGIVAGGSPAWLWGRVAGDIVDVATLAASLKRGRARRNAGVALAAVAGVTALDVFCALMLGRPSRIERGRLAAQGAAQTLMRLPRRAAEAVRLQPTQAPWRRLRLEDRRRT